MSEPMTPAECDLRGMPFMPLDVTRLRDSDLALVATGDEFKAAVLLWCASWHQVPAGSLPNDERALAKLSGLDAKAWRRAREGALRGWTLADDGRLYHPVVAEKAAQAWAERHRFRERREKDRERLSEWRQKRTVKRVSNGDGNADETSKTGDRGQGSTNARESRLPPDLLDKVWSSAPQKARDRSSRADTSKALAAAIRRGGEPDDIVASLNRYWQSADASKDGGAYAKGVHRMIAEDRWREWSTDQAAKSVADDAETDADWRRRLGWWREDRRWIEAMYGPPPGEPGCRVPKHLLQEAQA